MVPLQNEWFAQWSNHMFPSSDNVEMVHLELNFYEHEVNETLLVREDIYVGQIFPRIPNLQDENALLDRQNECRIVLVDIMDCQVQRLSMKIGCIKEAYEPTLEVPIANVLIDNDTTTCVSKFFTFFLTF